MNGSTTKFLRRFSRWTFDEQKRQGKLPKVPQPGSPVEARMLRVGYQRLKGHWKELNHIQRGVFRMRAERLMARETKHKAAESLKGMSGG